MKQVVNRFIFFINTIFILSLISCTNININNNYLNVTEACEQLLMANGDIGTQTIFIRNAEELKTLSNVLNTKNNTNLKVGLDLSYSNISYIGECFKNCNCLNLVILPKKLRNISECAFEGCTNLKSVHIPEHVSEIKPYAFLNCVSLNNVVFEGNECTSLGYASFMNCKSLNEIIISTSIKTINKNSFSGCQNINFNIGVNNKWNYKDLNNKGNTVVLKDYSTYPWRFELTRF